MSKHRGEPEFEVFEPGDIVTIKPTPDYEPKYRFLVCIDGVMTIGEWRFHFGPPLTSQHYVKVDSLGTRGL